MKNPLVSFLVQCYDTDSLQKCIRSIKSQASKDFDITYIIPRNGTSSDQGICYFCTIPGELERLSGKYVVVIDSDLYLVNRGLVDLIGQLSLCAGPPDIVRWRSPRIHCSYAIERSLFIRTVSVCDPMTVPTCLIKNLFSQDGLKVFTIQDDVIRGRGGPVE